MLDHVENLLLHREGEEDDEIDEQDGPEDRDVQYLEERAKDGDQERLCRRIPAAHGNGA